MLGKIVFRGVVLEGLWIFKYHTVKFAFLKFGSFRIVMNLWLVVLPVIWKVSLIVYLVELIQLHFEQLLDDGQLIFLLAYLTLLGL